MPSRARRTTPSRIGPRPTHLWYWLRGADDIVHLGQAVHDRAQRRSVHLLHRRSRRRPPMGSRTRRRPRPNLTRHATRNPGQRSLSRFRQNATTTRSDTSRANDFLPRPRYAGTTVSGPWRGSRAAAADLQGDRVCAPQGANGHPRCRPHRPFASGSGNHPRQRQRAPSPTPSMPSDPVSSVSACFPTLGGTPVAPSPSHAPPCPRTAARGRSSQPTTAT